MPPRKRLGQLLTELKIVDEHQLQSALGHQKQWGGKLGAILVQKGFCREDQVVAALSQHLSMPAVRLADAKIDPRAVKMVSRAVAERLHVFAYEVTGSGRSEVITIAMSDPTDLSAVDQLAFHTGKRIKPMLAGDTEVLAAIQKYYAPEKPAEAPQPPVPAGLRPFVDGAAKGAPGAAARPTPISPMQAVAAASAAAPRPSRPYMTPLQSAPVPAPPPPAPPPEEAPEALALEGDDLPADAPMDGLEPIAAHSQGETSLEGADGIPPPGAEAGSGDEPVPLEDPSALQGWAEGSQEGVPLDSAQSEPEAAGPIAAPARAWGEPTVPPGASQLAADELPIDAILGTADVLEHAEATPAAAGAPEAWSDISDPLAAQPEPSSPAVEPSRDAIPPEPERGEQTESDSPSSESGEEWEAAAAAIEAAATESPEPSADDGVAPDVEAFEAEDPGAAASPESSEEEEAARASAEELSFLESPDDAPAPLDEVSIDAGGWSEEPAESGGGEDAAEPAFSMSSPAEEPPSETDAEASFDVDTQDGADAAPDGYAEDQEISATQRHGWLLRHRDPEGTSEDATSPEDLAQHEASAQQDSAGSESFEEQQRYEQQEGYDLQEGTDSASVDDRPAYDSAEMEHQDSYAQDVGDEQSQTGQGEESIELATDEGWSGQPEDAQSGGWFGDALSSTTPLSPADLGTLAALGLDPADGAAAQRMLACLVRVLNRRQAIDLDELAAEIRESQLAADAATPEQAEDQPGAASDAEPSADDPANVQD
jgi:Type II secretion system (T2SS), protein E, N-terminal domain